MASNANQITLDSPVNHGAGADNPWPNKIGASTPYDFDARYLTAYGGMILATMQSSRVFHRSVAGDCSATLLT